MHANPTTASPIVDKRTILIVDDEEINREILTAILEDEYNVLLAQDGDQALDMVRAHAATISLVMLDLIMPRMSGQEVLRELRSDERTHDIPVIVATADQTREVECLKAGASDFIRKPYPDAGIVLARVRKTIELSEDRRTISQTERDSLTGLYSLEFFFAYAEQYDTYHENVATDAIVLDINKFSILNERYGRAYADEVLRRLSNRIRELAREAGGIAGRARADVFQLYLPHRDDYKSLLESVSDAVTDGQMGDGRVRVRMGVYSDVDKQLPIERRFDRAKTAADSVRNSYTRTIGIYDDVLHRNELYNEELIESFPQALEKHQFKVYFQPKYDIRPERPVLAGAEALVRWIHPDLGMISPGVFIPLFEENGLIQPLDMYIWGETARQIREWKDRLGFVVPVSVNVSRIDLYDPNVVYTLLKILQVNGLDAADLHLEITESAYTDNSEQIVEVVNHLRSLGFVIEMDDFGTGYSSLNMLATLPIDVLKLDMSFIRAAFSEGQDTHMISVVIDIAEHLKVPVIAEGVETEEQLRTLRALGSDIVQGYYFSAPKPPQEFERFLMEERDSEAAKRDDHAAEQDNPSRSEKQDVDTEQTVSTPLWIRKLPAIPLSWTAMIVLIATVTCGLALFLCDTLVNSNYQRLDQASESYLETKAAASDLESASDYLTEMVRCFVVTGDESYCRKYFIEANKTQRRDQAVENLSRLLGGESTEAYTRLSEARDLSNELMGYECRAMRYVYEALGKDSSSMPSEVAAVVLTDEEQSLSYDELREQAMTLVFDSNYHNYKIRIKEHTTSCTHELMELFDQQRKQASTQVSFLLGLQTALTVLLLIANVFSLVLVELWVRRPLVHMMRMMEDQRDIVPSGASELRYVAKTYNNVFDEMRKTNERLAYRSSHDALTGLFNRNAYDVMCQDLDMSSCAVAAIDVDHFKSINDTFGHNVGDLVLRHVAEVLRYCFRSDDLLFRLGGDEFVAVLSNVDSTQSKLVSEIVEHCNAMLQRPTNDFPQVSISVGVAFSDREHPEGEILKDADTALYRMKHEGRGGCMVFDD